MEYQEIMQELYTKLPDYLSSQGIVIDERTGFFSCIHPDHPDTNPSCSIGGNLDGKVFHCFCLNSKSYVYTVNGLKQMKDLKLNDMIYSNTGLTKVTNHIIRKMHEEENLYKFSTGNLHNYTYDCTDNHKTFYVEQSDIVKLPYIYRSKNSDTGLKFEGRRYILDTKHKLIMREDTPNKINVGDFLLTPVIKPNIKFPIDYDSFNLDVSKFIKPYKSGPKNDRITSIKLTKDLMWAFGLYCAEGSSYRGGITITVNRNEADLAQKWSNIISNSFNKTVNNKKYESRDSVQNEYCSSTDLQHIFDGLFNKYSYEKSPKFDIMNLPISYQDAFINGVFDGDGTHNEYKDKVLSITSKTLALLIKQLLINNKQVCSFTKINKSNDDKRQDIYSVRWNLVYSLTHFYEKINGQDYLLSIIKDKECIKSEIEVCDLTVDNDMHSFLSEHILTHNSGRGHDGNIFTAAHWLENLPIIGKDFWEVTVRTLCERYDIEFKAMEVSEDERIRYQAYRTLSDSARIMHSMAYDGEDLKTTHVGIKHLLDRGITEESIKEFNIGVLTSYKEYTDALNKLGHTDEEFLHNKGALNKSIFNRDSCILPIHDLKNRVVGFVSRHVRHAPNEHGTGKYINSIASDIYTKGTILYGYNKAIKENGPLYIVEGYLDAVYLRQCGLKKIAAIGATALTEAHVNLLANNETDIILCFDADQGGIDGTRLAVERLAIYSKFNIKILELPDGEDPDTYVRKHGLEAFLNLNKISPFYWSLKNTKYSDDLTVTAEKMVPVIASETSSIARLRMIKDLSAHTAISELDIKSDVDALVNKVDSKFLDELREVNQFVQMQLSRRRVGDTKAIIREAKARVDVIDERYNNSRDMKMEYYNRVIELENKIISGAYKHGFITPKFKSLEDTLDGLPFWANLMYLGGRPSAGKSLRPGTPVLMYNGTIKKIEDVNIGDQLMGPDSKPKKVLALGTGEEEMYDIIPKRGMKWGCNEPHILSLRMSSDNCDVYKKDQIFNIPIKEYMDKGAKFKHHAKQWRTGWDLPKQNISYDAYYIGSWLGDGTKTNAEITSGDPEYVESYYKSFAEKYGFRLSKYHQERNTYRYRMCKTSGKTNLLLNYLRDKCVINNEKRIPKEYLYNSREIRLELLAGLIDTDGYLVRNDSGTYEISTKYKGLRDDILYLGNSLGFLSTYTDKIVKIKEGDIRTYYRINISGDINNVPVKIDRKKSITNNRRTNHLNIGFDIKSTGKGIYHGVVLDGDHLFLLADGTVTHNTAYMTALSLDVIESNPDSAVFYMSIDDNMDLLTTKTLAVRSGLTTTEIRNYSTLSPDKKDRFVEAMDFIKTISDRYIVADVSMGCTVDVLENHVKWFCKEYPKQKKLFLLDNFHKLNMEMRGQSQKRDAISDASSRIKDIADLNDISIMATVELRKLHNEQDRPTRQDMQGSNKLDYDANVVGLVHNDFQVNRETHVFHHMEHNNYTHKMPWIEVDICKNKINGRSEQLVYKYNSYNMQFNEGRLSDWKALRCKMHQRALSFGGGR